MAFKFNPFTGTLDLVGSGGASGTGTDNRIVRWDGTGVQALKDSEAVLDDDALYPFNDSELDLGTSSSFFNNMYANVWHLGDKIVQGTNTIILDNGVGNSSWTTFGSILFDNPTVIFNGLVRPRVDNTNDLGTSALQWKRLYLSGQLISTVSGTSPFSVSSSIVNTNLNADMVDGLHASSFALAATTISTTSPLTGGGDLSTNRTFAINNAAADGTTKGAATFTAADFSDNGSGLISIDYTNGQTASASLKGFLTSADWTTFNSKVSAARAINTTSPLSGGGDLSADRTLSIADAAADGSTKGAAAFTAADFNSSSGVISIDYTNGQAAASGTKGFLTSTDWNTFNGKVAGPGSSTDNAIARYDGTTGKLIQNSSVTVSDFGRLDLPANGNIGFNSGAVLIGEDGGTLLANADQGALFFCSHGDYYFVADNGSMQFTGAHDATFSTPAKFQMGFTGVYAKMTGIVKDFFADVNNSGTSETDLFTYTFAGSSLVTNGDKVVAHYQLVCAGAALSSQQMKIYFGGTNIYDSGALSIGAATDNFTFNVVVIRVSSSVVRCSVSVSSDFATLFPYSKYTEVTGLTLSNSQIIKITGTASGASGASNQITAKEGYIALFPSATAT